MAYQIEIRFGHIIGRLPCCFHKLVQVGCCCEGRHITECLKKHAVLFGFISFQSRGSIFRTQAIQPVCCAYSSATAKATASARRVLNSIPCCIGDRKLSSEVTAESVLVNSTSRVDLAPEVDTVETNRRRVPAISVFDLLSRASSNTSLSPATVLPADVS